MFLPLVFHAFAARLFLTPTARAGQNRSVGGILGRETVLSLAQRVHRQIRPVDKGTEPAPGQQHDAVYETALRLYWPAQPVISSLNVD
jgi:hypothetical protein